MNVNVPHKHSINNSCLNIHPIKLINKIYFIFCPQNIQFSVFQISLIIFQKLKSGKFKKVLLLATGALMSTTTNQQGDPIPSVSHLIMVES